MKHYIINNRLIDEGADDYQVCFEDMAKFCNVADKTEIDEMKTFLANDNWYGLKQL
jgi:hypothetical protein